MLMIVLMFTTGNFSWSQVLTITFTESDGNVVNELSGSLDLSLMTASGEDPSSSDSV